MTRSVPPSRRVGFTLVELLVAITVFSIAILALAGTMVPIIRLQATAERRVEMTNLASDKLAEAQASALAGLTPTLGGSLTVGESGFTESVTGLSGRSYLRRWTIEAGPLSNTFRITVRVILLSENITVDLSTMVVV